MNSPSLVETVFLSALEKATPQERAVFLDEACKGDAELRGRVERLLAAHPKAGDFLEKPAAAPVATGEFTPRPEAGHSEDGAAAPAKTTEFYPNVKPGVVIAGRYTLIEKIGEGGMGEVWVAKQTEPVKRRVALKLIKAGMDSKAVLQRFDQERQALAMMDHPHISKVLDGGLTDDRHPYFIMELVNGLPLTKFCDEAKLPPRQRLELFVPICQAIQHAHQKGIVHRDLKPANILVTMIDGRPVPKVIDFGVAKATGGRLTDESMSTQFGAVVGTLEYMSPEQAGFSGVDVDTRSDIYSLGVILYELLTGLKPHDGQRLRKAALTEMIRIIQEEEPSKPSTRLSTDAALPSLAAARQTEPKKLMAMLRGELDWVVMKCLEKQRDRRYETANGLARDIQRYLADEVVEARPPSAGYRLKKLVRRHKGQVLAASLVLLALLGGMAGTTWGLIEARSQKEEARRQEKIARDETAEKEEARLAEAERGVERDQALGKATHAMAREAMRAKQLDLANDELKHRLGVSNLVLAGAAYDNRDVRLAAERLELVLAEQRGWEWRYLKQQSFGGLYTLRAGATRTVAFSPDGTRFVTGGRGIEEGEQEVKVWDARTGTELFALKGLPNTGREITAGLFVAYSPDGTQLVTCHTDKTVRVWDARTGALLRELKGHTTGVECAAFSPDGTRLVTGGDALPRAIGIGGISGKQGPGETKVWDARSWTPLFDLKGHTGGVWSVAFSPDGMRIVTGGGDFNVPGEVKVWDAAKGGKAQLELNDITGGGGASSSSVAFSPDGARIITGNGDGIATVVDAKTGAVLLKLRQHARDTGAAQELWVGHGVRSAAFSPDGTRIVTTGGTRSSGEVTVWDARTGAELLALNGHTAHVMTSAFSPDGTRIITGSVDGTAKVWDARTGTGRVELPGQWRGVTSLAFSPDGARIVTASGERTAKVWDTHKGSVLLELNGTRGRVSRVSFSTDGTRIVTAGSDSDEKPGHATVWDAQTGKPLVELKGLKEPVRSAAFSRDGARIVTGGSSFGFAEGGYELKMWDARTGEVLYDLAEPRRQHIGNMNVTGWNVTFSSDGTRFVTAGGSDAKHLGTALIMRDARTGKTLSEMTIAAQCVAFSSDGKRMVTGAALDNLAKVWDAETGTQLLELIGHQGPVQSVAFSPDGKRIVTGSRDRTVKVWDVRTGAILVDLRGHTGSVQSVEFSSDGTSIATGSGGDGDKPGEAYLWDARSIPTPLVLKGHTEYIANVAFSPDSTRIATASHDRTAKVWDMRTGTTLLDLKGHTDVVESVSFSPDGSRIATASQNGTVKVWDARTGMLLRDLIGFKSNLQRVTFSQDGARIVIRQFDGAVKLWDAQTGKELQGEAIPKTAFTPNTRHEWTSPDGQFLAHVDGNRVELISLIMSEEELAHRRTRMELNSGVYRDGYLAARTAKDNFAAGFYLKLVPPAEQKVLIARADVRALAPLAALVNLHLGDGGRPELALPLLIEIANVKKAKLGPDDPETLEALEKLGNVHSQMGQLDKSISVFEEMVKVCEARFGRAAWQTLKAMGRLGAVYSHAGRKKEAVALLEEAHLAAKNDPDLAWVTTQLIDAYSKAGEQNKAVTVLVELLNSRKAKLGPDHADTLDSMNSLGVVYWQMRQFDKAISVFEELLKIQEKKLGRDDLDTKFTVANLGVNCKDAGNLKEAIPLLEEAHLAVKEYPELAFVTPLLLDTYAKAGEMAKRADLLQDISNGIKARLGPDHLDTLEAMQQLGVQYWQMRQLDKSVPLFEEILKGREAKLGRDHAKTLNAVANLGVNYRDAGKLQEAIPLLEEAHRASTKYPDLRWVTTDLMNAYANAGAHDKAINLMQENLAEARKTLPKDSPQLANLLAQSALILLERKEWNQAEPLIRECLAIREKLLPDGWQTFNSKAQLGAALLGQKKYTDAEPLLLAGYEGMKKREGTIPPQGKPRLTEAVQRLIELYTATNKPDEVKKWHAERTKNLGVAPSPQEKK